MIQEFLKILLGGSKQKLENHCSTLWQRNTLHETPCIQEVLSDCSGMKVFPPGNKLLVFLIRSEKPSEMIKTASYSMCAIGLPPLAPS